MNVLKESDAFRLYIVIILTVCAGLLFLILIRDLVIPYRVEAYIAGSVYEGLEPSEPGDRSINVTITQ